MAEATPFIGRNVFEQKQLPQGWESFPAVVEVDSSGCGRNRGIGSARVVTLVQVMGGVQAHASNDPFPSGWAGRGPSRREIMPA